MGQLASRVLLLQVGEARSHVPGAMEGADPEDLHDLRVAVRRMRAALRLFERALPAAHASLEGARTGLKASGAILGRARDLDVQVARMEEWVAATGRSTDPAAQQAVRILRRDRAVAHGAMRRHIKGPVFSRRLAAVEEASEAARAAPSRRTAVRLLRRPSKQALASVARARAEPADPRAFHALRIDIKRLRYALEFLGPALPFSTRKLVRSLRDAQDALGSLQDATVEQQVALRLIGTAGHDEGVRRALELYRLVRENQQREELASCVERLDPLEADVRALRGRL